MIWHTSMSVCEIISQCLLNGMYYSVSYVDLTKLAGSLSR